MVARSAKRAKVLVHGERAGDLGRIDGLLDELGADVVEAASVSDVGPLLEGGEIDLALADAGWKVDLLEHLLRGLDKRVEVPVVLLAHPGERVGWVEHSARRFHVALLVKPAARDELCAALRGGLALRARHRDHGGLRERIRRLDHELDRCRICRVELRRELRRANLELQKLRDEADAETRRRVWLLSAISHNLRTPVHEVALCYHLLEASGRDPAGAADWEGLTAGLRDGVAWLRELVDDLVDIARLDLGTMPTRAVDLPIEPFLMQATDESREEAARKGLAFSLDVVPPEAVATTDPVKLARILGNLTSNAVKFTDVGEVRVAVRLDAGALIATVSDTGRGIAPETLAGIFDEFSQVGNPERDRTKGTGLGLPLCRRLVASLGGSLDVESTPRQGSTFKVRLPGAT